MKKEEKLMDKQNFRIHVLPEQKIASLFVAQKIFNTLKQKPNAILGLATGSTPILTYQNLIKLFSELKSKKRAKFFNLQTFNLDEYVGLDKEHEQSYHYFMEKNLFNALEFIKKENIHFPEEGKDYDQLIASKGGIDLQILGIGINGHIGFNEPGSTKNSKTRKVDLAQSTIEANSRFFNSIEDVPTQAISMGLETIMKAKKIFLLAFGKNKKEIISKLLEYKNFNPEIPASILLEHPNLHIFIDEDACDCDSTEE